MDRWDNSILTMHLRSKNPQHVHGDGNDSTTTIAGKKAAMLGGINLRDPVRSIRRHQQTRTRLIVLAVALAVVLALAVRWAWRAYGL